MQSDYRTHTKIAPNEVYLFATESSYVLHIICKYVFAINDQQRWLKKFSEQQEDAKWRFLTMSRTTK